MPASPLIPPAARPTAYLALKKKDALLFDSREKKEEGREG